MPSCEIGEPGRSHQACLGWDLSRDGGHDAGPPAMTTQPYLPAGPAGGVPPALLRRRTSVLTWVTMAVLGVGALGIGLLLILTGGPVPAIVTTLLAAVSFPLLIAVCFWLDRYEPEPGRYRLAALGWGGVVAVILSFVEIGRAHV